MSDYIVSARKYRPSTFKTVVGQKSLTSTLKNAIEAGRLAQAYLFCGPRGVGKTSCARIFARTINCLTPTSEGEACGKCDSCIAMDQGNSYNIIELDAASNNSVEDIRNLTEQVNVPPQVGNYRVFIIDEVHMLSTSAFNAFLKTLEEPPKYVIFILATTEKHKVLPTILSRCQIYDFKRITTADMVEHLEYVAAQEGITVETEALNVIARKADGAMRDALSIFDQVAASSMGNITYQSTLANLNVLDYDYYFRLVEAFRVSDVAQALLIYSDVREKGFDSLFFVNGLASHIRDLMVAADSRTASLLEVADDLIPKYTSQAQSMPLQWYYDAIKILNDCDLNYRTATNKQLLVELALIRLSQLIGGGKTRETDVAPFKEMPKINTSSVQAPPAVQNPTQNRVQTSAPTPERVSVITTPPQVELASQNVSTPRKSAMEGARPKLRKRDNTNRLSDLESEDADDGHHVEQRQPVTEEGMSAAWGAYISMHPEAAMLVSSMKRGTPKQVGPEEFHIDVEHPALLQAYKLEMPKLIGFLRNKLANDYIFLTVALDDSVEIVKPMQPHELLKDIVDNNAELKNFLRDLDPEIV